MDSVREGEGYLATGLSLSSWQAPEVFAHFGTSSLLLAKDDEVEDAEGDDVLGKVTEAADGQEQERPRPLGHIGLQRWGSESNTAVRTARPPWGVTHSGFSGATLPVGEQAQAGHAVIPGAYTYSLRPSRRSARHNSNNNHHRSCQGSGGSGGTSGT